MPKTTFKGDPPTLLEHETFQQLLDVLAQRGYRVVGPTIRESAIVYDDLNSVEQLPIGYRDSQEGGTYRLKKTKEPRLFGYTLGPESWKKYLSPPRVQLWQAQRENGNLQILPTPPEQPSNGKQDPAPDTTPPLAMIGVRACELAAIAVQDRVFLEGPFVDPIYKARREKLFIVAVNCTLPGGTCFCASMGTGPKAASGFDLALTEVYAPPRHYFIVQVGSQIGSNILNDVTHRPASPDEIQTAESALAEASDHMGRTLDTTDIKELLYNNFEHPRWDNVASRCLTCGNCTMVCPTCFCTTIEDSVSLDGEHAERWRRWDSCFTSEFSYIFSASIRSSSKSRYRQWMSHKLASWIDQFGTSGCVGCGRCITWCPVGIDITEEVNAIRSSGQTVSAPTKRKSKSAAK